MWERIFSGDEEERNLGGEEGVYIPKGTEIQKIPRFSERNSLNDEPYPPVALSPYTNFH